MLIVTINTVATDVDDGGGKATIDVNDGGEGDDEGVSGGGSGDGGRRRAAMEGENLTMVVAVMDYNEGRRQGGGVHWQRGGGVHWRRR
ncbi:hypothetical protein RHGRI_017526 [Rhododendron griersonianum]|uniref:Uncharacterized protein n=1 Tax=Rhododendron griersonianum TaxID=479676 RepID=A0AAV6JY42_9ERIC|nr:hypothetical protein RHGRI_017526 [Rhododendron griersonianum]